MQLAEALSGRGRMQTGLLWLRGRGQGKPKVQMLDWSPGPASFILAHDLKGLWGKTEEDNGSLPELGPKGSATSWVVHTHTGLGIKRRGLEYRGQARP